MGALNPYFLLFIISFERISRLSENQKEELKVDVLMLPRGLGYEFSNWEGKSVANHIEKKFDVNLSVRQVQILHE